MNDVFAPPPTIPELSAEQRERQEQLARMGRALVVSAHGRSWVPAWQAGAYLYEIIVGQGGSKDGFSPEDEGFDMGRVPDGDGVYVCDLGWVDDGPGDWPGSREVLSQIATWRKVTFEEWEHHLKNEWPWEPEEGWA